jgi:curved DNA-binding protein CbpA
LNSNDYYKILGIMKKSSDKEIKNAYRRLARKYHPDRNSKVSDDIMKNINIAFEVLSDPEKRSQYDMTNFDDLVENNNEKNNNYNGAKNVKISSSNSSSSDYKTRFEKESSHMYSNTISSEDYSSNYHDDNLNFRIQGTSNINNLDIPKSQYQIIVEPSLCLAFGSCETLAPKVFVVEKNKRINPKAIVKSETGANIETILDAAKTCPTKAIIIIDRYSGERIYP